MTSDKTKQISRRETVLAYIFFGLFVLAGAVTLISTFSQASKGIYAVGWPSVDGTILSSSLEQQSGVEGSSDTFFVKINYGYEVNGKSFTGNRIHFGKHGYSSATKARQKQNDYAAGVKVNVYYDPSDPSESVLETGITWVSLITCGGALIFLAFGIGGWYTLRKRIR